MDVRIGVARWLMPAWGCAALLVLLSCPGGTTASALAGTTDQVVGQAMALDVAMEAGQDDPPPEPKENAKPKKGDPAEREALIEAIKAQAKAKKAAQAQARERQLAAGANTGQEPPPAGQVGPPAPGARPAGPGKVPGKKEAGCGKKGSGLDLTPPPPDKPQPKFACKSLGVTAEPVWQGQRVEFKFEIGNEGEGPLHIHVKGG